MKTLRHSLMFICCSIWMANLSFAQLNSDDPIYNQPVVNTPNDKPLNTNHISYDQLKALVTSYTVCENDSVTLTNNSTACTGYFWSTDSAGNNVLATNADYTTGALTASTSYFITQYNTVGNGNAAMPGQTGTYSSNVRGYWFQAPVDFIITAFYVPKDASTASSNVACVRFNSGPPPSFSTTTNDFTLLGLWQNETADTISSCIHVSAGDYIGVLGNRGDNNSYSTSPSSTTIDGNSVTISRMGMQFPLSSTAPQDLWQESGGSISRVEFFYSTGVDSASAYVTEIDVTVTPPDYTNTTADICLGDSIMLEGAYQTIAGSYNDTLTNSVGCDSIVTTQLTVHDTSSNQIIEICQGDSILVHGSYENTAGTYTNTVTTSLGCDSTSTVEIVVNSLPATPTIDAFSPDTVCSQNGIVPCPTGTPSGGYYTGNGVSGSDFDPSAAGTGTHVIGYVMVDTNNCESDAATTTINVIDCAAISENTLAGVSVYPNPTENTIFIQLPQSQDGPLSVTIFDASGKKISEWQNVNTTITYDMSDLSSGLYVVQVQSKDKEAKFKITKK